MRTFQSKTYYPATPHPARWLAVGFLAGAVSVLLFHQGAVAVLNSLDLTARAPYVMEPTQPLGIPQVWSLALWGGAWGAVLATLLRSYDGPPLVAAALVLGATLPTLVSWFVVAPLKGQPIAAGFEPTAMIVSIIVNTVWGLGTGLGLALLGRKRPVERRHTSADRRRADRRQPQVVEVAPEPA